MRSKKEELDELYLGIKEYGFEQGDGYVLIEKFVEIMERHQNETKMGQAACKDGENFLDHMNEFDYDKAYEILSGEWSKEDLLAMKTLFSKSVEMVDRVLKEKRLLDPSEPQEPANLVWTNPDVPYETNS